MQLLSLIRQHKPAASLAGHDHSMALAMDANKTVAKDKTAYIVSGAGGSCTLGNQGEGVMKTTAYLISGARAGGGCLGGGEGVPIRRR